MIQRIIIWILTSLLAKADPEFGKRLNAFEKSKAETEAKERATQVRIAVDQATIAADQVEQADIEQRQKQLESEADAIAAQRKELRDAAETNPVIRPSDDDLLAGPLPGSASKSS